MEADWAADYTTAGDMAAAAAGETADREDSAGMAGRAGKLGNSEKVGMADMADRRADTAGRKTDMAGRKADMVDRGRGALSAPGRAERALPGDTAPERDRGGMDLVLEDLDDPTSNRRRGAGTAACSSNSSRLYYGIRSSNSRAWKRRGHCSRNIH